LKATFLFISLFFFFFIGFSQTEKIISGKVVSGEMPLSAIDVINVTTKQMATTDSKGNFTVAATVNDEIYILSKEYNDRRLIVNHAILKSNLIIELEKKPIELEEVKIEQKALGSYKVSQADIDAVKLEKQITRPVNSSVYTGEIVNGMDFVRIAKGIAKLFKNKNKDTKIAKEEIVFKDYVTDNFQEEFYIKTLGLKKESIFIFIEFCDADPNSKLLVQNQNSLEMMDYLITKNKVFKELK
jgi:hypothetical protein